MTKKKGENRLMQLELSQLRIDGGTQPRAAIHEDTVAEYAGALRDGAKFPPVIVFRDGVACWLADGFHRYHAHRRAGLTNIEADVRDGTLRDAILFAVGANTDHGLRRTPEDKRKAVETMLTHELAKLDDDGHPWSDNVIAKRCGVHQTYVGRVKASLMPSISEERPQTQTRTYITKHGTKAVMNTAKIGRSNKRRPSGPAPIAKDAFKPVQFHAENGPVPMRTISLPLKNPRQAAKGLLSVFGEEYVRKLAAELNLILQNKKGS